MHSDLITQPLALLLFENWYYHTVLVWQNWYYLRADTNRRASTFRVYTVHVLDIFKIDCMFYYILEWLGRIPIMIDCSQSILAESISCIHKVWCIENCPISIVVSFFSSFCKKLRSYVITMQIVIQDKWISGQSSNSSFLIS